MLNYDRVKNRDFGEVEQTYSVNDTILYALGVGLGSDPLDRHQLRYLFEEGEDFAALPSMAVVLGSPGFWARDPETGIDWQKLLHGEQGLTLHAPLPVAATVVGVTRVTDIVDKGDKGAFIYSDRTLYDKASGDKIATLTATTVARGDGGYDGPSGEVRAAHKMPERDADVSCELPTLPQAALIYRLSGDPNPLHASPAVAANAGFKAPILHGLCTLGVAGHAILKTCCDYEPQKLVSLDLRFSAPVYPGETIRTDIWRDGNTLSFQAVALERDVRVLSNGCAVLAD